MLEPKDKGMQCLTGKAGRRSKCHFFLCGFRAGRLAGAAIGGIADQRMAKMGEMNPDLMGAAGLQAAFDQGSQRPRIGPEYLQHPVTRARQLAAASQDRHPLAVERTASDLAFDDPVGRARHAPDHRIVSTLDRVVGELLGQAGHGALGFGGDEKARCVFVQPVNDAGPGFAADAHQAVAAMGDQGIDQSAIRIAGGGMNHQSRGLFDHDEVLVLIDHIEWNILAARARFRCRGDKDLKNVTPFDPVIGVFYRRTIAGDAAFAQQLLDAGPGQVTKRTGQDTVKTMPRLGRVHRHLVM